MPQINKNQNDPLILKVASLIIEKIYLTTHLRYFFSKLVLQANFPNEMFMYDDKNLLNHVFCDESTVHL